MHRSLRRKQVFSSIKNNFLNTQHRFFINGRTHNLPQPHPIPHLNVIGDMVTRCKANGLSNVMEGTILVVRQHVLETTGTILKEWGELGLDPKNVYVLGKIYSTSSAVEQSFHEAGFNVFPDFAPQLPGYYANARAQALRQLWHSVTQAMENKSFARCIILDDGGLCIESAPQTVLSEIPTAAIEQTRGGLYNPVVQNVLFPVINVAKSAAKRFVEPPMISKAILKRFEHFRQKLHLTPEVRIGIIGAGAIGINMAQTLTENGFKVYIYDSKDDAFDHITSTNLYRVSNVNTLISNADYIFGLTGDDCTAGIARSIIKESRSDKVFISGSSEDKEFNELLQVISEMQRGRVFSSPFEELTIFNDYKAKISVLEGGFPYNFNRQPWNVSAEDIAMTQGLLFGAVIQAALSAKKPSGNGYTINQPTQEMLDPAIQQFVVKSWQRHRQPQGYNPGFFAQFDDQQWIEHNSDGIHSSKTLLNKCFDSSPSRELEIVQSPRTQLC